MKKVIYYIIMVIIILGSIFLLTGCGSDSSKNETNTTSNTPVTTHNVTTETIAPEINTPTPSSIATDEPNIVSPTAIVPTPVATTTATTTSVPTSTTSTTSTTATTSGKTTILKPNVTVTWAKWKIELDENSKKFMTVYGTDEVKDVVWEYKTEASNVSNFEFLGECNQKLYINELGKIVTINKQNGSIVWENDEYKGTGSYYKFDSTGCIYIASSSTPALFVIDSTGKTVRKVDTLNNYDSSKVSEFAISGSNLIISYSDGKTLTLDINTIKDSSKNLF